jgi:hypothetical protein
MGGPERNDDETIAFETGDGQQLDLTDGVNREKLNQTTVNEIAQILAEKYPPKSDMHAWITGVEFLGERPKRHVLSRIYISVAIGSPGITLEKIKSSISDIVSAYKKAVEDVTHLIDTE